MREIVLAHSDDADDAAMFLAIARGIVAVPGIAFHTVKSDIATLNAMASRGDVDVCAVSVAHVPRVRDLYDLLPHGGSVGRGYGPVVVARSPGAPLFRVGVPGLSTTAAAVLRMAVPEARQVEQVGASLADVRAALDQGELDAAVLVHEGRLVYRAAGLHLRLDLGAFWQSETGLPLPLGANVIRRDLGPALVSELTAALGASIAWAAEHRSEVLDALTEHGRTRGLDRAGLAEYLDLYANTDTLAWDETCRIAIAELLRRVELDLSPVPPSL